MSKLFKTKHLILRKRKRKKINSDSQEEGERGGMKSK